MKVMVKMMVIPHVMTPVMFPQSRLATMLSALIQQWRQDLCGANSTPVHEFEEIKEWLVKPQNAVSKVPEDSPCFSEQADGCCLALVAKLMANKWKWLGRSLAVPDVTIDNIQTENQSEDERSYQVLKSWCRTKGSKATVHSLMKALQEVGDVEAMEGLDRHLGERHVEGTAI
ncbi:hypothetical protein OS493_021076 [Desmophyllum pertusum]|uniref:Death domain-containing protein n=1 Tax=Desmophyllum pertusum TaxID=174260 RepID=A0A9X0A0V5_9CNID|nr:hypothetical protein OS493_021076 [Desmophyllum pertusum]